MLVLPSPAKLNLFLHVTGRRSDGYHRLQTLFQLLDWGDELGFTLLDRDVIEIDMPGMEIPLENNLIYRAARLLRETASRPLPGVSVRVTKRIPDSGGLGGGSSNAATALHALNQLWSLNVDNQTLQQLGLTLGADVPLFVAGHSAWAEGIGEQLEPLTLPEYWYLIIHPNCRVATGEIFSSRELTRNSLPITIAAFFKGGTRNDCQPVVQSLYPEVDKALKWLENFGDARLTGTGACIFASWPDKASAETVAQQVPSGWNSYLARGINTSPLISALEASED